MSAEQRHEAAERAAAALTNVMETARHAVPANFGSAKIHLPSDPDRQFPTTVRPTYRTTSTLATGGPPGFWLGYMGEYFVFHALHAAFPDYADRINWVSGNGMQGQFSKRPRERLVDFVVDDEEGWITGHPKCVALIEVTSTSSDLEEGTCYLTPTQVTLALELVREGWAPFCKVPVMTLELAKHLALPMDVSEPLMGKPVLYMIMRVAGLDKPPNAHTKTPVADSKTTPPKAGSKTQPPKESKASKSSVASSSKAAPKPSWVPPSLWTKGKPFISFVLHDPAAMRRAGHITWVPQSSTGFRVNLLNYEPNEGNGAPNDSTTWVSVERIRKDFPPPAGGAAQSDSSEDGDEEEEDEDEDEEEEEDNEEESDG